MARWFVARTSLGSNAVYGPYGEDDLKLMLRRGQVSWQDQVSRGGDDPWRPMVSVPEIAQGPDVPAMPPPPGAAPTYAPGAMTGMRSQMAAGLFGILLGTFGAHKFYNGSWGWGIIYLVFSCTWIPAIAGVIEGILYLTDPGKYDHNYNQIPPDPWKW
jgi:TM2 domain-containing membrane protein YozV